MKVEQGAPRQASTVSNTAMTFGTIGRNYTVGSTGGRNMSQGVPPAHVLEVVEQRSVLLPKQGLPHKLLQHFIFSFFLVQCFKPSLKKDVN